MSRNRNLLLTVLTLAILSLACGLSTSDNPAKQLTAQAIGTLASAKATGSAGDDSLSVSAVQTAEANATAIIQSADSTQAALSQLSDEAKNATATAFSPILSELPQYGIDPAQGRPGWIHPPVTLEINGKYQYDYENRFLNTIAADFVASTDITWNTQYGGSGCGFVVRSDGNEEALNQYLVIATRGASGHVIFATMANGEVVTGQDIYAYGLDPEFDWRNDTTNRLTVVGLGNSFNIYTNGTLIGEVDPTAPPPQPYIPPPPQEPEDKSDPEVMAAYAVAQAEYQTVVNTIRAQYNARLSAYETADKEFERGFVAMVALSESGQTTCNFDNTWLWLVE